MNTLLQINTSLFSNGGQSSRLADEFVAAWRGTHPEGEIIKRDLAADPVPHLTAERFGAFLAKPEERTPEQHAVAGHSDALIDELRRADVIVIGLPMYNFGVPSTLKAYFDHIARAGATFRYTEKGPQGLLVGKKVYVFATRGGAYAGTPLDTQTGYVRDFLKFLGMDDVEFVYAEGLAMGEAGKNASLARASQEVRAIAKKRDASALRAVA
jgi:FMN-dependent NADH-azoreductase